MKSPSLDSCLLLETNVRQLAGNRWQWETHRTYSIYHKWLVWTGPYEDEPF